MGGATYKKKREIQRHGDLSFSLLFPDLSDAFIFSFVSSAALGQTLETFSSAVAFAFGFCTIFPIRLLLLLSLQGYEHETQQREAKVFQPFLR